MKSGSSGTRGRVLVMGLAVSGEAVARVLVGEGADVVAVDDDTTGRARECAARLGIPILVAPDAGELRAAISAAATVVVSPGIPPSHPIFELSAEESVPLTTEIELAGLRNSPETMVVAITGTNGKTSVTNLTTRMLCTSGIAARAVGNIGTPVLESLGSGDVLVAEVSSFQLALTRTFRPDVAVWLNVAQDHLDVHGSMEAYVGAKAKIFANQRPADVAVVNAGDPVVMAAAEAARSRKVTFGIGTPGRTPDYTIVGEPAILAGPGGEPIVAVADLPRRYPHDLANALAATAAACEIGASAADCGAVLREFTGFHHRIAPVADAGGVRFFDDSKATTPASVVAAAAGFDSIVLIAGGRNKGLDLSVLKDSCPAVHDVIAIGEASGDIERTFAGACPVRTAGSMADAVAAAYSCARAGDVILLSPGCTSFDWYGSYAERGEDFAHCVRELVHRLDAGDHVAR